MIEQHLIAGEQLPSILLPPFLFLDVLQQFLSWLGLSVGCT